jgi:2'-5' RNA ligase
VAESNPAPENKPHARLFVAILVPEAVKDRIYSTQQKLKAAEADVRWTDRRQFHLTLRFLGNVALEQAPALVESASKACSRFAHLKMTARGLGFFPNPRRPRVIWVGVGEATDQLGQLQRAVQTTTLPFTTEPTEKAFTGHITLGRFKSFDAPGARALVQAAEGASGSVFGDWECTEIHIMRSQLSPKGAIHTAFASLKLGGS